MTTPRAPLRDPLAEDLELVHEAVRQAVPLRRALLPIVVFLGLVAGGVVFAERSTGPSSSATMLSAAFPAGSCSFDRRSDPGREHVTSAPTYAVDPPAGGPHLPIPAPAGVYRPDNAPSDGYLVHSLEHGYVIIWYDERLAAPPESVVHDLRQYARDVIIAPRNLGNLAIAATAWHARLLCDDVELSQLRAFVTTFRNQGPERVPHY
jgi:hypothetical protein